MRIHMAAAMLGAFLLLGEGAEVERPQGSVGAPSAWGAASAPSDGHAGAMSDADLTGVVQQYCVRCHSDQRLRGNLSLESFDVESAADRAATAEQMITKLRAGMMPPAGSRRPAGDSLLILVETLEQRIDEAARRSPQPGSRVFQRLNSTLR